ncbi:MAG: hypothetical protein ACREOD_04530 [Candidatus Dormibacteria bacterium]
MWQERLPGEEQRGRSPLARLRHWRRPAARLIVPALVLAIAGAVVAASFGYSALGAALAAAVVLGLGISTALYYRQPAATRPRNWWQ